MEQRTRARIWTAAIYLVLAGIPTALAYWKSWIWGAAFTAIALILPASVALIIASRERLLRR